MIQFAFSKSLEKILPWGKQVALAYCHLPLVLLVGFTTDQPGWEWLTIVGIIPWWGMVIPFLMLVLTLGLFFLPGVMDGQPASCLSPTVSFLIVAIGTSALFFPTYWFTIKRAIDPVRKKWTWRTFLVVWTLIGNFFAINLPPRGNTPNTSQIETETKHGSTVDSLGLAENNEPGENSN